MALQEINFTEIEKIISKPRLRSYKALINSSDVTRLVGAYQWNKHVASAIYPILQCLEVSLRNAVHNAATEHFKTPDWFDNITKLTGNVMFLAYMKKHPDKSDQFYRHGISKGKRGKLKKWTSHHESMLLGAKQKLIRSDKSPIADAVVAELMLGFWTGLFESNYSDIHSKCKLWPHLEGVVFPNLISADRISSVIHSKLLPIKDIRNRLSHHEPIWKHSTVKDPLSAIAYLKWIVNDMIELINGISTFRKEMLCRAGTISYFNGICSKATLDYYLDGAKNEKIDKRNLKRLIERSIKRPLVSPVIIGNKSTPKFIVDLWLP